MAAPLVNNNHNRENRRPDPDPTVLTTQQLDKAVSSLREVIEARLIGSDKAVELLQAATDRIPAHVAASVARLQELHEEKFGSITIQFAERDKRTEQLSLASATAIAAALQAQKESAGSTTEMVITAMAKMEATFTKLIEQSQQAQAAQAKSMDDKINLLNSRLDKGEGRQTYTDPQIIEMMAELKGLRESRASGAGKAEGINLAWVVLVAVVTIVIAGSGLAAIVLSRTPAPPQVIYAPPSLAR